MSDFVKFPRTPHLAWLGSGMSGDDKVLSIGEREAFLAGEVVVEEKVDGANVGLSVGSDGRLRAQNRGGFISQGAHLQFDPLWAWVAERETVLVDVLGPNLTLFGEWCFAVHSVRYDRLPEFLLGFDVFDKGVRRFWSSERRDELLQRIAIPPVPRLACGFFTWSEVLRMLDRPSDLGGATIEGVYLRREKEGWLNQRAKLVRARFAEAIGEHWSRRPLEKNRVVSPGEFAKREDTA